jgi:hypothetical protein
MMMVVAPHSLMPFDWAEEGERAETLPFDGRMNLDKKCRQQGCSDCDGSKDVLICSCQWNNQEGRCAIAKDGMVMVMLGCLSSLFLCVSTVLCGYGDGMLHKKRKNTMKKGRS